ncbi:MAG: ABC transporter ATP-binding protein [Acidimicrobiia bacterium]
MTGALDELPAGRATAADRRSAAVVWARDLRKVHGEYEAVRGIDLEVERGECFGLLGPNGAGKSSTMRMISCVSPASGGVLDVLGLDAATKGKAVRSRLGVVPQDDTLDVELTVEENLLVYGRYFGLSRRECRARTGRLLEFASLERWAKHRVGQLSGGMRRRLTIARALVSDPELLLLDEPTTGLDPQARHLVWDRLHSLKRDGVTLLLTTHFMDEAEQLCDRIAMVDGGRIVSQGRPDELIDRHCSRAVVEVRVEADGDAEALAAVVAVGGGVDRVEALSDRVLAYAADGDAVAVELESWGILPHRVRVRRATLEDVFLLIAGRRLVD